MNAAQYLYCDRPSQNELLRRRKQLKASQYQEYADYLARVKTDYMKGTRNTMLCLSFQAFVRG